MSWEGGTESLELYQPPNLQIGPINLRNLSFVAKVDLSQLSEYFGKPIFGVLGVSAMKKFVVQIDFDAKRLRFLKPDFDAHREWGRAMGFEAMAGVPEIIVRLSNGEFPFLLDTGGSREILMPTDGFDKMVASLHAKTVPGSIRTLIGETDSRSMRCSSDLVVLGWHYHDLIISETKSKTASFGLPFLSRHMVTFDFPHFIFYMKPGRGFSRRDEFQVDGPVVLWKKSMVVFSDLDEYGALYRAGVRDGDILLGMNGNTASNWDLIDLRELLQSYDVDGARGHALSFKFQSGNQVRTVTVKSQGNEPATRPADDVASKAALASLKALVTKGRLELSTAPTSAADQFCVKLSMQFGSGASAGYPPPAQDIVIRDGDRAAVLEQTPTGDCRAYCTDGLFLMIDHDHPGSIKRAQIGFPNVEFDEGPDGLFHFQCGIDLDGYEDQISIALGQLIETMIANAKYSSYDNVAKCFTVQCPHSNWRIEVSSADAPFAIKSATMQGDDFTLTLSVLACGALPDRYRGLLKSPAKIEKELANARIRVEDFRASELTAEALDSAFRIPLDFGKDPRERATASKLKVLLLQDGTTTRP